MYRRLPLRPSLLLASSVLAALTCLATAAPDDAAPVLLARPSQGELPAVPPVAVGLPHPTEVLGYPLGSRFTPPHRILDYLEKLDAASDRVQVEEYGRTYEDRPLTLVTITSPAALARRDELRRSNLRLAGGEVSAAVRDDLLDNQPVVVWLAYGVHGNETSSSEAALATAYVLAAGGGEIEKFLEQAIVLIDPDVNPDGRARYLHAYESRAGVVPDPAAEAAEHLEPWPGGRQNHYLVDLNRDWAWASQVETRHRLAVYRAWEPQVYVDFHEMGAESTYYFPPAADPVHPEIDPAMVAWQEVFGRGNAEVFDRQGWLYFNREVYDLFYPGYGDTYPSLRGAVGMTYEMAGGGRAGSLLQLDDGRTLSLADRVVRHFATSLATVRTAALNRRRLLRDFAAARSAARSNPVRTYLWSPDQCEARALADLLEEHGLRVEELAAATTLVARQLAGGSDVEHRFPAGTFAVSTDQPLSPLLRALMEPHSEIPAPFVAEQRRRVEDHHEPDFYDVTGWSLPLAFNVDTWVADAILSGLRAPSDAEAGIRGRGEVGFLIPPQGLGSYRLAADLLGRKQPLRAALEPFTSDGRNYPAGSLFIPRPGSPDDLESFLGERAAAAGVVVERVATSATSEGPSLGSDRVPAVKIPRIGLLCGPGVQATSFGFLWHLLDRQVGLPHSRLELQTLERVPLERFDVLVLPDLDDEDVALAGKVGERLEAWVRAGGVLVVVGEGVEWLQARELTRIETWEPSENTAEPFPFDDPEASDGLERRELMTPGAILATDLTRHHPLTAGIESSPPVLFTGSRVLLASGDPKIDVLTVRADNPLLGGLVWPEALERLRGALLVAVENVDDGKIVTFSQDPAFRLFWRGTTPLFLNALLLLPSAGG